MTDSGWQLGRGCTDEFLIFAGKAYNQNIGAPEDDETFWIRLNVPVRDSARNM